MLAFITSYWFITLPTLLTGAYLVKIWKNVHDEKEKNARKERVPVRSQRSQHHGQPPHH